jgi:putative peptidoglycan lipid II flippase
MALPKIFHSKLTNIHQAAFWLAFFSIVSAFLGLFRDRMFAALFGASRELDIYYAAFRMPDMIYTATLFFAASTIIIPVFLEAHRENKTVAEELFGALFSLFCGVVVILSLVSFVLMPWIISLLLPGFSSSEQATAVSMSRIMLLSPFFLGLSNIFSSITQAFQRFFVYSLSAVFYNMGILIGIFFFLPRMGIEGLAWGVALGALFHVGIQMPTLLSLDLRPRFRVLWDRRMRRIVMLSLPRSIGLTTTQLVLSVVTGIASTLRVGSIAIFNFATNLQSIPVTLIGFSYSVAVFPSLSEAALCKDRSAFQKCFSLAFRHIIFWTVPATVLLLVLRAQIVRVVLGSGRFDWSDTRLTAASLFLLSLAIVFQSLIMLLVRALYADNETMRPVIINVITGFVSIGAAFWFVRMLGNGGLIEVVLRWMMHLPQDIIPDIRMLSLPLGILIGGLVNLIFLFFTFRAVFGWYPTRGSEAVIMQSTVSSIVGGVVAYWMLGIGAGLFNIQTFVGIFAQGFFAGACGLFGIVGVLWALKNEELVELYNGMKKTLWRDRIPTPEPEHLP